MVGQLELLNDKIETIRSVIIRYILDDRKRGHAIRAVEVDVD